MSKTSVGAGSSNAQFVQAAGLFAQSMQRNSKLNQMVGTMPKGEGSAAATLRKQTTNDMPIVRTVDLSRGKGDEVEFHFVQPVGAYPIMGARMAEGKGTGVSLDKARVRVNQARFPVDVGDTMTDLRSPVEFRKIGRPIAQGLMDRYQDQGSLMHLAGARGFHNNIEWAIPTQPGLTNTVGSAPRAAQAATAASASGELPEGVYNHGRGQYSDQASGMGFPAGFTGKPNARNLAAADMATQDLERSAPPEYQSMSEKGQLPATGPDGEQLIVGCDVPYYVASYDAPLEVVINGATLTPQNYPIPWPSLEALPSLAVRAAIDPGSWQGSSAAGVVELLQEDKVIAAWALPPRGSPVPLASIAPINPAQMTGFIASA